MNEGQHDFAFGTFRMWRGRRRLTGAAGPVTLGTRAFDLLLVLAERAGTVVSKHDLLDLVWPGQVVEEGNLHVQIAALRKALGPEHDFIRNVPGRGYCFAVDVRKPTDRQVEPAAPSSNFPILDGGLIGRDAELRELQTLLEDNRLLTITGPSGIGKTHLALVLGDTVRRRFPGGARLIDLAPLNDPALIEGLLLTALDLRVTAASNAMDAIAAALTNRPALLLFDNCEHLLDAVAAVARMLMQRCGALRIIATSQETLRIPGEKLYRLDPLALPPGADRPEALRRYGAIELFLLRVEAADRHFRFGPENSETVTRICRDLDGIPLALEMAAARAPSLGLEALRDRLGERLRVLSSGARTADRRHRTLRGTMSFSYDLLAPSDRAVFRQLGIFVGGFTAQAAARVLASEDADDWAVVDALSRLVDKSLVAASAGDTPRYRLLETPRLFALEQMGGAAERAGIALCHARYFDRILREAYDAWETTDDDVWLARTAPELGNVRAAADFTLADAGAAALAISLIGSAALLWDRLSLLGEGRSYIDRAEQLLDSNTPPAAAAQLYREVGNLWYFSDRPRALAALQRAAALYRTLGDRARLGAVLTLLGPLHSVMGTPAAAEAALREARDGLHVAANRKSMFNILNHLGILAANNESVAESRDFFEQALLIAKGFGAPDREAAALINLAEIEFMSGDIEAALQRASAAVDLLQTAKQDADLGWVLVNISAYLLILRRLPEAERAARHAISLVRGLGGLILRACLQNLALLAASLGHLEDAARLCGFVDAGYAAAGEAREYTDQCTHDQLRTQLTQGLPRAAQEEFTAEGALWTEAKAIACVDSFLSTLEQTA